MRRMGLTLVMVRLIVALFSSVALAAVKVGSRRAGGSRFVTGGGSPALFFRGL